MKLFIHVAALAGATLARALFIKASWNVVIVPAFGVPSITLWSALLLRALFTALTSRAHHSAELSSERDNVVFAFDATAASIVTGVTYLVATGLILLYEYA